MAKSYETNVTMMQQLFEEEVQRRIDVRTTKLREQVEQEVQSEMFPKVSSYRTCMVPGCTTKHSARGYCGKHYQSIWHKKNK